MLRLPNNSRNNKFAIGGIAATSVIAVSLMAGSVMSGFGESDTVVHNKLVKIVSAMNTQLPARIDAHTRLESTDALPGRRFLYRCTIVDMEELPRRDEIVKEARPRIAKAYREAVDMEEIRNLNVTLVYSYSDEAGKEVARFEVTPDDA